MSKGHDVILTNVRHSSQGCQQYRVLGVGCNVNELSDPACFCRHLQGIVQILQVRQSPLVRLTVLVATHLHKRGVVGGIGLTDP